jgi:hypothetical protein
MRVLHTAHLKKANNTVKKNHKLLIHMNKHREL